MRKVTKTVVGAFLRREAASVDNTRTDGQKLVLHGNTIAFHDAMAPGFHVTTAGWDTVTTRDRLNALPGVKVWRHRGVQFLNGVPWDGETTFIPQAAS